MPRRPGPLHHGTPILTPEPRTPPTSDRGGSRVAEQAGTAPRPSAASGSARQAFVGELVGHSQAFQMLAVGAAVERERTAPEVIGRS